MLDTPDEKPPLTGDELHVILVQHKKWLESDGKEGQRADLFQKNLTNANFMGQNLSRANLGHANLTNAILGGTNLSEAKLIMATLSGANLSRASLISADLFDANLSGADLGLAKMTGAMLAGADLSGAKLNATNLSGAVLNSANLSDADLRGADLTNADLADARLENADLRDVRGLRLDRTFIRGAQFSPVVNRWWAYCTIHAYNVLRGVFEDRKWFETVPRHGYDERNSDLWSLLRQLYSGPRTWFLFFFVVLFALPYVGRAALYSTLSNAEQRVIDATTAKQEEWRAAPPMVIEMWREHKKDQWRQPHRAVAGPIADALPTPHDDWTPLDKPEAWVRKHSQPRPLWQILLKWDGWSANSIVGFGLAVLLVFYNIGLYTLITSVNPLRGEEERSGWSPAWKDYGYLRYFHWGVTFLFFVSLSSFLVNIVTLLGETVWVPAHAG